MRQGERTRAKSRRHSTGREKFPPLPPRATLMRPKKSRPVMEEIRASANGDDAFVEWCERNQANYRWQTEFDARLDYKLARRKGKRP